MAKTREGKPASRRWSIFRFGKKMAWLGHVEAASESEAREKAYKLFKIAEAERFRIIAKAEE